MEKRSTPRLLPASTSFFSVQLFYLESVHEGLNGIGPAPGETLRLREMGFFIWNAEFQEDEGGKKRAR